MNSYSALSIAAIAFVIGSEPALADELKESVIAGYRDRCIEVQTKAGRDVAEVTAGCKCEASVLDANYSTFELISVSLRGKMDRRTVSEEEIRDFKQKLSACRSKNENSK